MFRKLSILLLAWLFLLPGQAVSAQSYAAERFDVIIDIQPDGSFLVTETVVFRFEGGPFTYAFREIELDQLDRLEILSARMDGLVLPQGTDPGQVEIDTRGDPYAVTWHFEPTTGQVRTFTLQYRVIGNLRIADNRDVLYWQVIPSDHEYRIEWSTIEIRFPSDVTPDDRPRLEGMAADITIEPGRIRWQVVDIPDDQGLSAWVGFPPGTFIERPPDWQVTAIQRSNRLRAALPYVAGILVLAGGLTAWWMVTQRRRSAGRRPRSIPTGELSAPPDDLSPAQAGYLVHRLRTHMGDGAAALLWLAERGAIRLVEESRHGFLAKTDYRIELIDPRVPLKPHEAEPLELLFPNRRQPDKPVYLSAVSTKFASRWPKISQTLQAEMKSLGFFDEAEAGRKQRIERIAILLLVAGFGLGVLGLFFILSSGAALAFSGALLLAAAGGLLIASLGMFFTAATWIPTTPAGAVQRKRWEGFRDHLKAMTRAEQWVDPALLNHYLPYAVAFDFGDAWTRLYRRQEMDASLPWLITATGEQAEVSSMIAAVAVISSIGDGGPAGGAGAGGGGGGASGAG